MSDGNDNRKRPYICSALSELSAEEGQMIRSLNERLADICLEVLGIRAFVPHEHYDPIIHASYTPPDVDKAERRQVCELCSLLIVVAYAPSWGGGIEVEMANRSDVPIVIMRPQGKRISRLLLGNRAVTQVIDYSLENLEPSLALLRNLLGALLVKTPHIPDLLNPS